ncbi:hypothetical protein BJ138DRAFT_284372 [Hygrophoropsis aurantiaca]|uniref:Uncharacterized protein n=1 Tax=Hygrophoropsis aurantiaca TaxID=72124 RepID=A0ACB8AVV1_9AGAM|nr:hypothetical protein BJ138DRAFT_284372 [Hygrophoropsis aurantiaca]
MGHHFSNAIFAFLCLTLAVSPSVLGCKDNILGEEAEEGKHACQFANKNEIARTTDSVPWQFAVYTGPNCQGDHHLHYIERQATVYESCWLCRKFDSPLIDGHVESMVYTTSHVSWNYRLDVRMVLALKVYSDDNCQDEVATMKGKFMVNTNPTGRNIHSFTVCYIPDLFGS